MNQFTVPQFIDVEDKIIGPITTRQFIIVLVTGLFIFLAYKIFTFSVFAIIGVILFGIGGTLAFLRINGQPFHFFLLNLMQTWRSPNLQIWDKEVSNAVLKEYLKTGPPPPRPPKPRKRALASSRLAEISLIVDTGGVYTPEV